MSSKRMTKEQMAYYMKEVALMKKQFKKNTDTTMKILFYYSLWQDLNFSDERFYQYMDRFDEYYEYMFYKDELNIPYLNQLQDRLFKEADFNVEYVNYDINDCVNKKSKTYVIEKKHFELNEKINEYSCAYFTIHFNTLLDFGFGKKKMQTNKQYIANLLNELEGNEDKVMQFRNELCEKRGIEIEMPDWS